MENLRSARGGTLASKNQSAYKEPFIQFYPSQAQELADKKSKNHKVSGRFLSLLYQRLNFWSQYSKHIFEGKRFFWKSADELSKEIYASTKQVYRGLKALEELGLIERHKLRKHQYNHTYFYHLPHSVHTKEATAPTTSTTRSNRNRSNCSSRAGGSSHKGRQDHPTTSPYVSHIDPAEGPAGPEEAVGPVPVASGGAGGGSAPQGQTAGPAAAGATTSQTTSGNRSSTNRTTGLNIPIKEQSISNIQLKQIVEKCMLIGKYGIKPLTGGGIGFAT